jgi:hypothetical protein
MSGHKTLKSSEIKPIKVDSLFLKSFEKYKSSINLNDKKKL